MCGIVGAVSSRNIVPILVQGLQRLEYRGYDSCGVAVHSASPDYPNIALVTMNPGWVKTDMGGSGAPTSVTSYMASAAKVRSKN